MHHALFEPWLFGFAVEVKLVEVTASAGLIDPVAGIANDHWYLTCRLAVDERERLVQESIFIVPFSHILTSPESGKTFGVV